MAPRGADSWQKTTQLHTRIQVPHRSESARDMKTFAQIGQEHEVRLNQVRAWKKQLQEEGVQVFSKRHDRIEKERQHKEVALYEQNGGLQMELGWLKKAARFD